MSPHEIGRGQIWLPQKLEWVDAERWTTVRMGRAAILMIWMLTSTTNCSRWVTLKEVTDG